MGGVKILSLSVGVWLAWTMTVFAVEYSSQTLRDPFNNVAVKVEKVQPPPPVVKGSSVKDEITAMSLELQGLIWHSSAPRAIISGKILKIGSEIKGVEVLDINKKGVRMHYKGQEFYLHRRVSAPAKEEPAPVAKEPQEFQWQPYSSNAVRLAISGHKRVIIEFFAEWSLKCRKMEALVFSDPQIQAGVAQGIALRVDETSGHDPVIASFFDEYKVTSIPTIIFLDSNGREITGTRLVGVVSKKNFHRSLDVWKGK